MSKRHFLLYDFLLPLLGILGAGFFLSDQFDTSLFRWLDSLKAFGIGAWFRHSSVRVPLWNVSWMIFAAGPALFWLVWMRVNLEYDWVERRRRLDRPIFNFVHGFFRWVEGTDDGKWKLQSAEFRAAQAVDHARKLEGELARTKKDFADLEADYQALEEETDTMVALQDQYRDGTSHQAG